ncbi:hypothetical protein B0A49_04049 [Cryomyces minteri]|uniref:Altered inheritance of mitochondria protein 13, mitochondrial n=1 Tax=Cryomyces minteri TaxID=331657 RepID=A0A4U0XGA5_9PEZI|nr:hypothetical protein B0A49_04049 [Cryomyces minteri]
MGSGSSKPEAQHVFSADTPVRFSQEASTKKLIGRNFKTDSTRSRNLELQIQSRVTTELERILRSSTQRLTDLQDQISSEEHSASPVSEPADPSLVERIGDKLTGQDTAAKHHQKNVSRDSVSEEIAELKRKLQARKKLEGMDRGVEKAKEDVVQCLRKNDRRPLDCWKEVETFRNEVGRLEKAFVERTVR